MTACHPEIGANDPQIPGERERIELLAGFDKIRAVTSGTGRS
jgi:hypothetical protein